LKTWYLWAGVGAIEDLVDVDSREDAVAHLRNRFYKDWTLWEREGTTATLLGVKTAAGIEVRFY
jgi:hypothetical protein